MKYIQVFVYNPLQCNNFRKEVRGVDGNARMGTQSCIHFRDQNMDLYDV